MRVLALTGESDRSESALFVGLKQAGVDIKVIGTPHAHLSAQLKEAAIPLTNLPCKSRLDLSVIRFLRAKIRTYPFDIIHAFTSRMLSNVIVASYGMPGSIIGYRGTTGHISRFDPMSWLTYLNPKVTAISCVSGAVRSYLESCRIPSHKLYVVYKGHHIDWYQDSHRLSLSEFGIPPESFTVACIANVRHVKGVDILIQAFRQILEQQSSASQPHLLLIGDTRHSSIQSLAQGWESHIHFLGYRPDATQLVRHCSLYVQPSRAREGLPKAVIEAMSQGVPVIVSNAGGMPELVRDQIDGLVCQAGDVEDLARAITQMQQNQQLLSRFGSAGQDRIRTGFSIENTISKTLELYEHLGKAK